MVFSPSDSDALKRGSSVARLGPVTSAFVIGVLGSLILATTAVAEVPHSLTANFGAATSTPVNPYPLANPSDVAVDDSGGSATGAIYVTDPANHRVQKFDAAGNFLLMFGREVNSGTGDPNVCTNAGAPTDICQAGTPGGAASQFNFPQWIAIDNSPGPSNGDVYVADSVEKQVQKFDPSGNLIASWAEAGLLKGTPGTPFSGALRGIAVDMHGNLFTYIEKGAANGTVHKFDGDGVYSTEKFDTTGGVSEKAGIAVDVEDHLYVVGPTGSSFVKKYDGKGNLLGQVQPPSQTVGIAAGSEGLARNDVYAVNGNGAQVDHLHASCSQACVAVETLGAGDLIAAEGVAVDGQSNTIYVANTGTGSVAVFGPVIRKPSIDGFYASNVTATSADLHAAINPGGSPTQYHFEYGTTPEYGASTPPVSIGSGPRSVPDTVAHP